MDRSFCEYYRCPEQYSSFASNGAVSKESGYFKFGNIILYGRTYGSAPAGSPDHHLRDVLPETRIEHRTIRLPFDASSVLDNLRYERYANSSSNGHPSKSLVGRAYYLIRPALPVKVRRHLQKFRLNGWHHLRFPNWPVDRTVDETLEKLLLMSLRAHGLEQMPFIWFWPEGASSCALMTHDVETEAGRDFCPTLMDINDAFGIHASFQVVPERRYEVPDSYLQSIRKRGFEVNVQDLNHDGHLYRDREEFLTRAEKINAYGRDFKAAGFRSAVLYRRQEWYDALQFSYDMSVPNVAHLDPQRGGCCTVMPYFVGNLVELPVTMTQDYSLFHILNDRSIDLWMRQSELVMEKHGLIHFIVHPDYITDEPEQNTYKALLGYLSKLRAEQNVWIPLPHEAAAWWRQRSQMRLVEVDGTWQIEGKGKERARIAYASEKDNQLVFSFEDKSKAAVAAQIN